MDRDREAQTHQQQDQLECRLVVLGTSSKYRHRLFSKHFPNIPFTHVAPSINEQAIQVAAIPRHLCDARELTLAIAHAKADALLNVVTGTMTGADCESTAASTTSTAHSNGTILITSDQVVVCDGIIVEKPSSPQECETFLRAYAIHPVQTVCAVVVTVVGRERVRFEGVDVATQHLKPLPDLIIKQLIEKGDVLHCAGGITVEDPLLAPYLGTRQGTLDSIMGLPVSLVNTLLCQAGVDTSMPVPV